MPSFYRFCLLFIGLTLSFALPAQDLRKDYTPLTSSGNLPPVFTKTYTEKTKEDQMLLRDKNFTTLAQKRQFTKQNDFAVDNILRGGDVLYNDSIGIYANKVLDEVLRNDPDLRGKLQLYVIKSTYVNAYTFGNGIILINTGLISQLEDEAELAFVLCHEIIHFKHEHSVNRYIDFSSVPRDGGYSRANHSTDELEYSRDQETDADTAGLNLFKTTRYSFDAIHTAFDVLQYSYLPFDEVEFNASFFEDGALKFPKDYTLEKTAPIKSDDNYDDSKSSHPNIRKRRSMVNSLVDSTLSNAGRKRFIVSESSFQHVKDISRFETCRLYLHSLDYPNAIYSAYILLKKYPDNVYLKKIIGKALYQLASYNAGYKHSDQTNTVFNSQKSRQEIPDYKDIEGFSQQVYYLLGKLSSDESTVLALSYNWKLNQSLRYADKQVSRICDSLFVILTQKNEKTKADFSLKTRAEIVLQDSLSKIKATALTENKPKVDTTGHEMSKYERIKAQQHKEEVTEIKEKKEENFSRYAFTDLLKDKKFVERFQYFADNKPLSGRSNLTYAERRAKRKKELKYGTALSIDKIVVVDPFYFSLNYLREASIDLDNTVLGEQRFHDAMLHTAARANVECVALDPKRIPGNEINGYNDFVTADEWLEERLKHAYNQQVLVGSVDNKDAFIAKYGTPYIMYTGVVTVSRHSRNYTFLTIMVYNINTEQLMYSDTRKIKMKGSEEIMISNYYDIFKQVHARPKENKSEHKPVLSH